MGTEQYITEHLDLWATAIKYRSTAGRGSSGKVELYGIKKLRELILELAVRGLLVPQDPKDEPASELLKEIAAEKSKLVKTGKIKKDKPLPPITDADKPFMEPANWLFVKLREISYINGGYAFKSNDYSVEGMRVIRISDFDENGLKSETIVRHKYTEKLSQFLLLENCILMAMTGGTVGKSLLVKRIDEPMLVNQRVASINLIPPTSSDYINILVRTNLVQDVITEAKNSTNDNISMEDISGFIVPFPPLDEQHRIVAKVDELMSLCDQLEQQTDASLSAHRTLVETLLNTLTSAADHAQFTSSWQRIAEHFDTLFTTEQSIDQLKQTILQLAVMGKLVPQDPKDEPASELLNKITAERVALLSARKTKYRDVSEHPDVSGLLYDIPKQWHWYSFSDVVYYQEGPGIRVWQFKSSGIKLLNVSNILPNGMLDFDNSDKYVSTEEFAEKYEHFKVLDGDLLFAGSGGSWGKSSWFCNPGYDVMLNTSTIRLRFFSEEFCPNYLKIFMDSDFFRRQMSVQLVGIQPNFGSTHLGRVFIPIPPPKEQYRIVSKIDELTMLCDQLKSRLRASQATCLIFADALTDNVLAEDK